MWYLSKGYTRICYTESSSTRGKNSWEKKKLVGYKVVPLSKKTHVMVGEMLKKYKAMLVNRNEKSRDIPAGLIHYSVYHLSIAPKPALQLRPPISIDSVGRWRLVLTEFKKNKLFVKPSIGPDLIARWIPHLAPFIKMRVSLTISDYFQCLCAVNSSWPHHCVFMINACQLKKKNSKAYNMQRQLSRFVRCLERSGRIQRPPTVGPGR